MSTQKNSPQNFKLLLTNAIKPLKKDTATLKGDVNILKSDMVQVKGDVNTLKKDVTALKKDVVILKKDVSSLNKKADVAEKRMDKMSSTLGVLSEKVYYLGEEMKEVKSEIKLLPTKEEFFNAMDKLMKEFKDMRDVQETTGGQLAGHSDKIENHEERIVKLEQTTFTNEQ